jgi:hypothetical protein
MPLKTIMPVMRRLDVFELIFFDISFAFLFWPNATNAIGLTKVRDFLIETFFLTNETNTISIEKETIT